MCGLRTIYEFSIQYQTHTYHVVARNLIRSHVSPTTLALVADLASELNQQGHAPQTRMCQNSTVTGTATYVTIFWSLISCLSLLWPEAQSSCFLSNGLVRQDLLTATSKLL
jgi:hypothetical protein